MILKLCYSTKIFILSLTVVIKRTC